MTDQPQLDLNVPNTEPMQTVEGYRFEPIKGYPMLHWKGKRPFTSTQYYPAQLKEVHGEEVDNWRSKIFWGDNLQVMSHLLKEFRGKVNLVYIDPPFDSRSDYKKRVLLRGRRVTSEFTAFEEKQYTDIWTNDEYLQFMYERLVLIKEILNEEGTIWLHCDYHKSHYLKCICDEIFAESNFVNEIVWNRATPRGNVKVGLSVAHDTILVYGRSQKLEWHPPLLAYSDEYKNRFTKVDSDGRFYTTDSLINPNPDRPNLDYEWRGVRRVWRVGREKMEEYEKQGKIEYTSNGVARQKRYLDELEGRPMTTIWDDIFPVNSQAKERQDYPTQKPETLLERILQIASSPDDIIFDCFMGSGTTQAVAMKLGRRFIGADINLGAVQITTKRLLKVAADLAQTQAQPAQGELPVAPGLRVIAGGKVGGTPLAADSGGSYGAGADTEDEDETAPTAPPEPTTFYTGFEVYNVNHYDVFRNPLEAKDLLLEALEVDRLEQGNLFDGVKDGRRVKIMPVNRIATRADLNELIAGFDYKTFEQKHQENARAPVEKITLVCMGHEPDLAAQLKKEVKPFELDVEVVDILRDKQDIQFKRDSEARIVAQGGELVIEAFYPMNLLGKLSLQQENVEDWRELVESVMIDWNYDGAVFQPLQVDIPSKNDLVTGRYPIPADAGTIRVKITDLLSESLEVEVATEP